MRSRAPRHRLGAALLAAVLPAATAAQTGAMERNPLRESPLEEPGGVPDAPVVRAGALDLLATTSLGMAHDSNVYFTDSSRRGDAVAVGEGQLQARAPAGAGDLGAVAFVRSRRHASASDQDAEEYGARLDFDTGAEASTRVQGSLRAHRRFESRTDVETPNTRELSYVREFDATLELGRAWSSTALRSRLHAGRLDYRQPGQDVRDRSRLGAEITASRRVSAGASALLVAGVRSDDYRLAGPGDHSALTTTFLAGVAYEVPELAGISFAAGRFHRDLRARPDSIDGLTLRAGAMLRPTRLTTVRFDLRREDEATRIAGEFGKVRLGSVLEVRHEWSRGLALLFRGTALRDRFEPTGRRDTTVLAGLGATWEVNRRVSVSLDYDYALRESDLHEERFRRHFAGVALQGRL